MEASRSIRFSSTPTSRSSTHAARDAYSCSSRQAIARVIPLERQRLDRLWTCGVRRMRRRRSTSLLRRALKSRTVPSAAWSRSTTCCRSTAARSWPTARSIDLGGRRGSHIDAPAIPATGKRGLFSSKRPKPFLAVSWLIARMHRGDEPALTGADIVRTYRSLLSQLRAATLLAMTAGTSIISPPSRAAECCLSAPFLDTDPVR